MPFKSEKQRRWMWANKPEMAKRGRLEETNQLKSPARLLKKLQEVEEKSKTRSKVAKPTKVQLPENVEKLDVYEKKLVVQ